MGMNQAVTNNLTGEFLQELIDQAGAGDHVTIPQGEYLLDQSLVIDKPLHVTGDNRVHCLVNGYFHAVDIRADQVSLSGIRFAVEIESDTSDFESLDEVPAIIHAYSVKECILHDCELNAKGSHFLGVFLKKCESARIEKICSRNARFGILVFDSSKVCLERNQCHDNQFFGIVLAQSKGRITRNECYGNEVSGIQLQEKSFAHIVENPCHGNKTGILLSQSRGRINGNECNGNKVSGIHLQEKSFAHIVENRCRDNQFGIILSQSKGRINGNECYGNEVSGIQLQEKSFAHIVENRCHDNEAGILLSQSRGRITGNECYGNEVSGIQLQEKSFAHIIENRCHDNEAGVLLIQSRGRITGNECFGNLQDGIRFQESSGFVHNNTCHENWVGVAIVSGSFATISGNRLYQNSEAPVVFENRDTSDSTVEDNIEQAPEDNELEQSWLARQPLGSALLELRLEIDRIDDLHSFIRSGCVGCFNRYWLS